jgi:phenylacetate-CoA ligase
MAGKLSQEYGRWSGWFELVQEVFHLAAAGSVLIVGPFPPPYGGMALQAKALVERLQKDGISVELLPTNPSVSAILSRVKGLRTVVQSLLFLWNLTFGISRFRVIHILGASHWYFVLRVAPTVILAKLFGRRVILNYRGGEAPSFFARFRLLVSPILRLVDVIVVPSAYLLRVFKAYGHNPVIVPNFVDLRRFRYRRRDRLKPNLLVTRSLEPLYNIKMALNAFGLVQKRHPDARIDVIGGGSEEKSLRNWVRQQGLPGVFFHGAMPSEEIPAYLENADILLNPTNADNMPINLLEAFASGVPVVTTNVGGIPDLVGQDEAALTVNPNDVVSMAARIEQLLSQPQTVTRVTTRARSLCEQFNWEKVGRLWTELYDAIGQGHDLKGENGFHLTTR